MIEEHDVAKRQSWIRATLLVPDCATRVVVFATKSLFLTLASPNLLHHNFHKATSATPGEDQIHVFLVVHSGLLCENIDTSDVNGRPAHKASTTN